MFFIILSLLKKNEINLASLIINYIFFLKRSLSKYKDINFFLKNKKKLIEKKYNIKIDYLELRNKTNLKLSNNTKNSKLFIAYSLRNIRLIDNI